MASEKRECNIGGGEEILENLSRKEVPLTFLLQHLQVEHKGVGGEEEEKLLFL